MLRSLIEFSVRRPWILAALGCLLLGAGVEAMMRAKLEVFPDFVPPQVTIQTEAPGLTPEQVEALVTRPVENAVNGAGGVEALRSQSIPGLSVVTVVFHDAVDVYHARQLVAERLTEATALLPAGVKPPRLSPLTSATMDLLKIGLVSDALSPMELRTFADWTVRPRLLAAPGVARASVFGGEVRQLQIQVRPERLQAFDLGIADIVAAARTATGVRGAGFVEGAGQRILIQTEGQSVTAEGLAAAVVSRPGGRSVRLGDVARVAEAPAPPFGDALIQGRPGVLLTLASQYGANTLDATREVEAALDELRPVMKARGVRLYDRLHRPASFIETAVANMTRSLALGAALVIVVLLLFLANLRAALISLTAIPLSLLAALLVLDRFGVSLNTLSLGGLVIALGEVVDDAIIDVENICRRLAENRRRTAPRPAAEVILEASLEVRGSVVFATFIVSAAFLPVIALNGLAGKFFAPLACAYVLAVMASLVVALTVTPALAALLLAGDAGAGAAPPLVRGLKRLYAALLRPWMARPILALAASAPLPAGAVVLAMSFGSEFLPPFREGHFVIQTAAAPGTSLPEMRRQGGRITGLLRTNAHIATVEEQIGRAESGEDTWGPHRAEFHIELKPTAGGDEEEVESGLRAAMKGFPGVASQVLTFLGDRISETLSGETAEVAVSVFGPDLDVLDAKAREIERALNATPGHSGVNLPSPPGGPRLSVRLRPERLRLFGVAPMEVLEAVETAYAGLIVGQCYDATRVTDVAVVLDPDLRRDPRGVGDLRVQAASGARIPLSELADVDLTVGRDSILHEGARRRQTVTCNVEGTDVSRFVDAARRRVDKEISLPEGYYLSWGGAAEEATRARSDLWVHSLAAAAVVALLLAMAVRGGRNLALVLANLPFALVGGVAAVALTGGVLSLGSLVGFVTLFGITTRNSIMLVSHLEHLVRSEGAPWSEDTVLRGAVERLGPILMTALVTALGLLPLALGASEAGREIEGPMAAVILGGLASSTALNLLLLPALAWRFGRFAPGAPSGAPAAP